jgi:hypothetical protein
MGANGTSNMANKTGKGGSRNIPELPRSDSDADSAPVPNCLSKSGNHLRSRTLALVERSSAMGASIRSQEISCRDSGKLCDSSRMRDIRRAFQRKLFHLWIPETAVDGEQRRKRFLGLRRSGRQTERMPTQGGRIR